MTFQSRELHAEDVPMTDAAARCDPRRGGVAAQAVTPERHDPPAQTVEAGEVVAELYRVHALALVRFALTLVGDRPTAEDVVQEAFAGLHRSVDRISDPGKSLAYLRVCVVNGCRSVHRSRRRVLGRPINHDPPVWSAESAAMAREDSRQALQAVAALPRRAREILAMRYYLDMPDTEIAAMLGVSRGTVSSTASRALSTLARQLKEVGP
jgi:RNA polymerase sigma-70 factor (sigma-E family)